MGSSINLNHFKKNTSKLEVWSVDRIGRLISGTLNTLFLLLGIFTNSYFLYFLIFLNLNSIFTTLTDSCPFQKLLVRLGAKEREELFHPGGEPIQK